MKPEGGWVKLYRKILDNSLWKENRVFSKAEAWIDIVLNANHSDNKILIDGKVIIVERGQWITSEVKLSNRWNWSRNKVRRFLNVLAVEEMCNSNGTTKYTTLTVVNYGFYQGGDTADETPDGTTERQQTEQQTEHKQECKNVKNDNKKDNGVKKFTPPSLQDVANYCNERSNGIDPQNFIDHYTANGWMVGKNKMKDWKASVRTWEAKRNQYPSGRTQNQPKPRDKQTEAERNQYILEHMYDNPTIPEDLQ